MLAQAVGHAGRAARAALLLWLLAAAATLAIRAALVPAAPARVARALHFDYRAAAPTATAAFLPPSMLRNGRVRARRRGANCACGGRNAANAPQLSLVSRRYGPEQHRPPPTSCPRARASAFE